MKIRSLLLLSLFTVSSTIAFAQEQRIKEEGKTVFKPHWFMQVPVSYTHLDVYKRQIQHLHDL